ncbi:hypothetical protein PHYPSEUDO_003824 [Phytophthora pseudosyringae]|uniref:Uncharacterized protein n=1 Tax=Phytophthora pseudosyringae TaxID=221518 RepID=A0A8T1WJ58_9STRA|nr:hypothetical protein PHYPSEUDO_003824 [Phytophthora pseudosyringae]
MAPMSTSSALVVAASPSTAPPPEEDAELLVDLSQLPAIPAAKSLLLINNFVANTTRFLNHFAHECEERVTRVSDSVTRVEILLAILEAKLNSIPDLNVSDAQVAAAANGDVALSANQMDLGISDQDLPSMEANGAPLPPPPPPAEEQGASIEGVPPPPPPSMDGMEGALIVPPPPPPSSPSGSMPPPPPSLMGDFDDDDDEEEAEVEESDGPPLLKLKDDPAYAKYFTMRRLGIPDQVIEHKLLMDGMDANVFNMDPEGPSPSGGLAPTMDAEPTGPILPIMAPPPPRSDSESDSEDERMELPPPPPSLSEPRNAERRLSGNIGMPFPLPPQLISPTSSIGGPASLFGDGPPAPPPPPPPSSTGRPAPPVSEMESSSDDDIEEFDVDDPPSAAADSGVMKLKDDPAFEKYFKMRKLGMPDGVIQHKLTMDGVTLDILNMDPEGPSPNATGAPTASAAAESALPPLPPGLPPPPARPVGGLPPPPVKRYDDSDSDFDSD